MEYVNKEFFFIPGNFPERSEVIFIWMRRDAKKRRNLWQSDNSSQKCAAHNQWVSVHSCKLEPGTVNWAPNMCRRLFISRTLSPREAQKRAERRDGDSYFELDAWLHLGIRQENISIHWIVNDYEKNEMTYLSRVYLSRRNDLDCPSDPTTSAGMLLELKAPNGWR